MVENLELDFSHRPPNPSVDEVESVCAFLAGKGWIKAAVIEAEIEISDRRMRRIAERSDGRILSGQKGYRLLDGTTPVEEIDHAANWLISQGRNMIRRGVAVRRRYHNFARPVA